MTNVDLTLPLADSFGGTIKKARKNLGMTQKEVAELCGVGSIYISRIENHSQKIPSDRVCLKLAEVLGLDRKGALRLAYRLKTPPESRQFLFPDIDSVLTETVDASIRKLVSDPSVKTLLIELSKADLPRDVVSKILKAWVDMFVEIVKALRKTPKKKERVYS